MLVTVLTSGLLSRPTQAELLNSATQSVGCLLNIGTCPPATNGDTQTTDPGSTTNSGDTTPPADPNTTPSNDTTKPSVAINADPILAGGTTQTINITGTVLDSNLASYSLAVNGNVAQSASDMTDTQASITIPWNVATPNVVPSGSYLITLDASDKAGNTAHTEVSVEVDNTPPDVTVEGGDVIIKVGSISPTTTADDAHGIASYTWTAKADNPGILDFDATAAEPTFTPDVEGSYVFYVDVADGLGNVTTKQFTFGYAQELATVPLPTESDPTTSLVDQSPSTVPVTTRASTHPTILSARDEIPVSDDTGVLGKTVTAPRDIASTTTVATIAPTSRGWSIFGILWYWWLVIIGLIVSVWAIVKKFVLRRIPEHS
jgi:hypothetical protein